MRFAISPSYERGRGASLKCELGARPKRKRGRRSRSGLGAGLSANGGIPDRRRGVTRRRRRGERKRGAGTPRVGGAAPHRLLETSGVAGPCAAEGGSAREGARKGAVGGARGDRVPRLDVARPYTTPRDLGTRQLPLHQALLHGPQESLRRDVRPHHGVHLG